MVVVAVGCRGVGGSVGASGRCYVSISHGYKLSKHKNIEQKMN